MFQNVSVNAVMALPGVTNRNTGVSIGMRSKFSIRRHDTWQVYIKLVRFLGKVGALTGSFLQENCKFRF